MLRAIAGAVVLNVVAATVCFAGSPAVKEQSYRRKHVEADKYVVLTGSLIPQKVKVQAIGTASASQVRVYDRREIGGIGRVTTTGILADDPSIRTFGH
jgi:flagellar basal body rod protein FlgC